MMFAAISCSDGVQNQGETDVDCGGSACAVRCALNKGCEDSSDCQSGLECRSSTCCT